MRIRLAIVLIIVMLVPQLLTAAGEPSHITQEELVRRTQELFDAVAPGNKEPWQKYFADDALFFDEKGHAMDKTALVKSIGPLPKGYSGTIKVVRPQSRFSGTTAVLSYDLDETETVFGQHLTARYHATDTWLYRNQRWQIVASQVLRYYEDPAVGTSDPDSTLYLGTYQLAPGVTMEISHDGDRLFAQRTGGKREELFPEAAGIFFRKGVEGRRLFHRAKDGSVDYLIDRRNNEDLIWKKVR